MPCAPDELLHKSQILTQAWERYRAAPSFENFVEFAVSINSFTEFLNDKGVAALHHASHELEQVTLALFSQEPPHSLPADVAADLDERIAALTRLVGLQAEAAANARERRQQRPSPEVTGPIRQLWLIGHDAQAWQELLEQFGYFGLETHFTRWEDGVPADVTGACVLLLDMRAMPVAAWRGEIEALRQRFGLGQLIAVGVASDFDQLHQALGGGCDSAILEGTPLHAMVQHVIELNELREQEPYRVLIVEDSKTASALVQRTLAENAIESQAVNDPRQALAALKLFQPDLILMDMYMPTCTGVELARIVRQHHEFLSVPIVYLSGETNVALQVDAMRLGGDHFLTKPFNPVFLNAIVRTKIERYRALRRSMHQDSLTGLLNHTSGKNTLDLVLSGVAEAGGVLSVVMMDIDHFKRVNDRYGHPVGDQVIRSLAWLLKQRLRRQDVLCRYGGEEFLIGLPHTDIQQALAIMDRVRLDFAQIRHPHRDSFFQVTCSAGIAGYPARANADALIKAADDALYQAKRSGRNCIEFARD